MSRAIREQGVLEAQETILKVDAYLLLLRLVSNCMGS